jgi:DNA mismatch repair ATPase MutL
MKQVILNIPENQLDFFLEVFKRLGLELHSQNEEIPDWQKAVTIRRLEAMKTKQDTAIDFDEMINRLENKHGL